MDTKEFNGVFNFTNFTKEDFTVLWNNKEYTFLAETTSPIIIPNETLENIQEIRKKFALKLATREFYNSKKYIEMSKQGRGLPPTFDEKILEVDIEKCLNPMPIVMAKVKEGKKNGGSYRASKAISDKENPNFVFKDEEVQEKGVMPTSEIK